jgi:hypothetical protein
MQQNMNVYTKPQSVPSGSKLQSRSQFRDAEIVNPEIRRATKEECQYHAPVFPTRSRLHNKSQTSR